MLAVAIPMLYDIVIMFAVSVVAIFIFNKIKLPPILGFLLAGILVGPYGLKLIDAVHEVEILAEIGVIFILFSIGLEFSITKLMKMKRNILQGGSIQVLLTIAAVTAVSAYFFDINRAVFLGFLAALSSTAIVLKLHQSSGSLGTPSGNISLSILIFQDIAILPMILLLPLLSGSSGSIGIAAVIFFAKIAGIAIFMFVAIKFVMPKLIFMVAKTRIKELFSISVLAICLFVVWLAAEFEISLALGAFLAGLILSETEFNHDALDLIEPFKDIFSSFFFVSIGMLLNLAFVADFFVLIIVISLGLLLLKFLIVFATAISLGYSGRAAFITGMVLAQVGEFSFVLAKSGFSYELIDASMYQTFIASAVITITATPFMFKASEKLASKFNPVLSRFKIKNALSRNAITKKLENHLVIIGYGINGRNLSNAAQKSGIEYIIIEMNPVTVKEETAKGIPMIYGDATQIPILQHASIEKAKFCVIVISDPAATREITRSVRNINSSIHLLVRTRFIQETEELMKLGADEVIPEEFETSIEIFNRILSYYLIPKNQIDEITHTVRQNSYQIFRVQNQGLNLRHIDLSLPNHEVISYKVGEYSDLISKQISELQIRQEYAINLIAIKKESGELISNLTPEIIIDKNDVLVLFGSQDDLYNFQNKMKESST